MNKTNKYVLMVIGVYQIIGGLFGFTGFTKLKMVDLADNYLLVLIISGYFTFAIISGITLLRQKWIQGIRLTQINQFLQVITVKIIGFGFLFSSSIYMGIGFSDTPNLHFITKFSFLRSVCHFWINNANSEISIMINIVPVVIILLLSRIVTKNEPIQKGIR